MGFWFHSIFIELVISILILLLGFILYFQFVFSYWKRKGIIQKKPSIPLGNVSDVIIRKKSLGKWTQDIYNYFNELHLPFGGLYLSYKPELMILDPYLINTIFTNDFEYFSNRGNYFDEELDPIYCNLFNLDGIKWKNLRKKLVSLFTVSKMKMMFPIMVECSQKLQKYIDDKAITSEPVDIKNIFARYTMDAFCSCGFGIETNTFKNPNTELTRNAHQIVNPKLIDILKFSISYINPEIFKTLKISVGNKQIADFFMRFFKDTVRHREENNIERLDFMHLLIQLKNDGKLPDDVNSTRDTDIENDAVKLTVKEIAANCYAFFFAGFETSSTMMTFLLYELSINLEIQEKLREEIQTVLKNHNNELTYDAIMEMTYLDRVIQETLRKYPSLPYLTRRSGKDYNIPNTNIILEKGTFIRISVFGIHHDPKYYPSPEKFNPDRFTKEEKAKRTPYTYLPFGIGPRTCVAYRFGLLQSKIGVCCLLRNFKFTLNGKTHQLEDDTSSLALGTKHPIYLNTKMVSNFI